MPIGVTYEACNEYIIRKLQKYVQQSGMQYSIYGHYIVVEKDLDFKKFKFIPRKYYLKRLKGKTPVPRWLNNKFESEVNYTSEIMKYCFKLKKMKNNKIILYIGKKKYELEYNLHIIRYFYKKMEKEFFERDYNVSYMDAKLTNNNDKFSDIKGALDVDDVEEFENKFDMFDEEQEYISSFDRKNISIDILRIFDGDNLNFNIFYEHYFVALTENQQKIVALHLLGIRQRDIARLLDSSQIYALLELKRLGAKIAKIYNKKKIKFWGDINVEEEKIETKRIPL
jgi:hypothetical protein